MSLFSRILFPRHPKAPGFGGGFPGLPNPGAPSRPGFPVGGLPLLPPGFRPPVWSPDPTFPPAMYFPKPRIPAPVNPPSARPPNWGVVPPPAWIYNPPPPRDIMPIRPEPPFGWNPPSSIRPSVCKFMFDNLHLLLNEIFNLYYDNKINDWAVSLANKNMSITLFDFVRRTLINQKPGCSNCYGENENGCCQQIFIKRYIPDECKPYAAKNKTIVTECQIGGNKSFGTCSFIHENDMEAATFLIQEYQKFIYKMAKTFWIPEGRIKQGTRYSINHPDQGLLVEIRGRSSIREQSYNIYDEVFLANGQRCNPAFGVQNACNPGDGARSRFFVNFITEPKYFKITRQ